MKDASHPFSGVMNVFVCFLFFALLCFALGQSVAMAHEGARSSKITYLGTKEKLVSVGFTKQSQRQFKVWDPRNLSKEIKKIDIDQAAGAWHGVACDEAFRLPAYYFLPPSLPLALSLCAVSVSFVFVFFLLDSFDFCSLGEIK